MKRKIQKFLKKGHNFKNHKIVPQKIKLLKIIEIINLLQDF